jgi:predicted lipoprotein
MKRRQFVLGQFAIATWVATGCRREPLTRQAALKALVHEVVVPATQAVIATSAELSVAVTNLSSSPSLDTLRAARAKFKPSLLAWKRAQCFRLGPMVDTNAFVRALFWPPRPQAIEAVLDSDNSIDAAFVGNLGVDARGVYAVEYLLFPLERDEGATAALFTGAAGARRRELARALAGNIEQCAANAGHSLGDGAAYAARFAQGAEISLSILVNQMIGTVENLSAHRLELVLGLEKSQRLKAQEVEGWPSASSHEIALAQLSGNEALYRGGKSGGLRALTRAMAPAIEARVSRRYAEALRAVRGLNAPLERVVTTDRPALEAAAQATKALELAIKVDLASALGVTITFQTGDGD